MTPVCRFGRLLPAAIAHLGVEQTPTHNMILETVAIIMGIKNLPEIIEKLKQPAAGVTGRLNGLEAAITESNRLLAALAENVKRSEDRIVAIESGLARMAADQIAIKKSASMSNAVSFLAFLAACAALAIVIAKHYF